MVQAGAMVCVNMRIVRFECDNELQEGSGEAHCTVSCRVNCDDNKLEQVFVPRLLCSHQHQALSGTGLPFHGSATMRREAGSSCPAKTCGLHDFWKTTFSTERDCVGVKQRCETFDCFLLGLPNCNSKIFSGSRLLSKELCQPIRGFLTKPCSSFCC